MIPFPPLHSETCTPASGWSRWWRQLGRHCWWRPTWRAPPWSRTRFLIWLIRSSKYSFWADQTRSNAKTGSLVGLIQISNLCSQLSLQQHVSFHRQTSEHQAWSRPSCWGGQRGGRGGRRRRRWWWTRTGEPSRGTPGTGPRCPPAGSRRWSGRAPPLRAPTATVLRKLVVKLKLR